MARRRIGNLAPSGGHRALAFAGAHRLAGDRRGHWCTAAGRQSGLAGGHAGFSRPPCARLGSVAAAGDASLCAGLRRGAGAGLRRPGANRVAPVVAGVFRLQRTSSVLGDRHPVPGVLPLCLHAGAAGLSDSGPCRDGTGPAAWPWSLGGVLPGGVADGPSGHRRRPGVGVDGNAGGLWRRFRLQFRHLHHRHL